MSNIKDFFDDDDDCDYEVIPYKGYDIYYNYYNEGEITVNFDDEDWWYKTLDDAKEAIDKRTNNV
jgi:hypothetical protein